MIYLFVTRKHAYTISWFLSDWASQKLKNHLKVFPYDKLALLQNIKPGVFIFSDLERLSKNQLAVLEDFCDQLSAHDENIPILNHPRSTITRFNLLQKLHKEGFNKFNAYPASEIECKPNYPVFLRFRNDHNGPLSGLLKNRNQRDAALLQAIMVGYDMDQLIQIEFCKTKDADGYYRKYAAFRIGNKIIPGHLIFNKDWLVKEGKPPFEKPHELEKENYLRENPHEEEIFEIFELAGITYGRIDYSMLDGSIQTWEINTNPILNKPRKILLKDRKELIPIKEQLAKKLEAQLMSLDYGGDAAEAKRLNYRISLNWHTKNYL